MRIAFVGKGGSGKSSISWLLANYFAQNKKVSAIDADYNMDLMHNFGVSEYSKPFLKTAEKDIYDIFNISLEQNAFDLVKNNKTEVFDLSESDFVKKYSYQINPKLSLMVLGDHDTETMYSGRCGHAYAKSIKFFVPYVNTKEDEVIIIDSVAGTDMVNYGLFLGVDLIVCVVEDTPNSVMVMKSTKKIASEYDIPFICIVNKYNGQSLKNIPVDIKPVALFSFDQAFSNYSFPDVSTSNIEACRNLEEYIYKNFEKKNTIYRLENWRNKNEEYKNS